MIICSILEYEKFLRNRRLGAHTVRNKTIVVLSFLNTLGIEDLITGRDLPDFTPREIETHSIDQLQKFFFACTAEENVTFQFFLHTGAARPGSAAYDLEPYRLRPWHRAHHAQDEDAPPRMDIPAQEQGVRSIPVPDSLLTILRAREKTATGELVFPSPAHWKSPQARPGRKTDRSLPRNVQKRDPPRPAELQDYCRVTEEALALRPVFTD